MITFSKPEVEQFFKTYQITDFTVNADETKILFTSNLNGAMNIWALTPDRPFPYLFTDPGQSTSFIKCDPEKRFVLAGYDQDGDENFHIYAVPYDGGKSQKLIGEDPSVKYFYAHLSKDGERIYYVTSDNNPSFLNGFVYDIKENKHRKIYEGAEAPTYITAVSEDESTAVVIKMYANTFKAGYLLDLSTGQMEPVSKNPGKVHEFNDAVFVSSDTLVYVTNEDEEFGYAVVFDINERKIRREIKIPGEEIEAVKWHKETGTLILQTASGVEDRLYSVSGLEGDPENLELPVSTLDKFIQADSGNFYILGRSAVNNFNIYRKKVGGDWEQITQNTVPGVPVHEMAEPEVVSYESFDGKEIEALWFKAKPDHANGHVIFWPHGGPQAAERKMFRAMFQAFLNRGYAIFAPNFRGSTGYGATFKKLVEQDWGEGPRLDCVAGIEWLFETGKCDRDKLFLIGGSYGGYMALLLAGRHPDYFRAVVDIFGVSNLFTFIKSVPDHWKPIMNRWLGDPEKDKERLTKDSPVTYLNTMTKPMLVIQGANDPRVVKEESDQIVEALRKQGTAVDYLVLDDEGHGFSKKKNEIAVYEKILSFLDTHK